MVYVDTGARSFEVEVNSSNIEAQNGDIGEHQNRIAGTITVWGKHEPVPNDEDGLDPEFEEKFSRTALPVRKIYFCLYLMNAHCGKLGVASGRLTVRNFARLVKLVSADKNCGFESRGSTQLHPGR